MNPAKKALLEQLVAEQHNGVWWITPPRHWNAGVSTVPFTTRDNDVIRARRRRELMDAVADITDEEIA